MRTTVHLDHVEDHEGDGRCGECGREGLRWIAVLSDGRRVGMKCSKALLGYKPAPKNYAWQADFTLLATHQDTPTQTYGLWQHKRAAQTRETLNGTLVAVGGVRDTWRQRGWPVPD